MQVHHVDVSAYIQQAHPEWAADAASGKAANQIHPASSGAVLRDVDGLARAGYALDNLPSAVMDVAVARQTRTGDLAQQFPALAGLIASGRNNTTVSMTWGAAFGNAALMNRTDLPVDKSFAGLAKKITDATVVAKPGVIELDAENGARLRIESVPAGAFKEGSPLRLSWERPDISEERTHIIFPDTPDGKAMIDELRNCLRLRIAGDEHRGHPMRQLFRALEAAEPGVCTDEKSLWGDSARVPVDTLPKDGRATFQGLNRAADGTLQLAGRTGRLGSQVPPMALTPAMALELACGIADRKDTAELDPTTWRDEERRTWQDLLSLASQPDPNCGETVPENVLHYLKPPIMPAVPKVTDLHDVPKSFAGMVIGILQSDTLRQSIHTLYGGKPEDDWSKSFTLRVTDNHGLTENRLALGLRMDAKDPNALTEYQCDASVAQDFDNILARRADAATNATVQSLRQMLAAIMKAPVSAAR